MAKSKNPFASLDEVTARQKAKFAAIAEKQGVNEKRDLSLPGNPMTVGARVKSAEERAAKQIKNSKAAGSEWLKNVLRPKKNPIEAAIAANDKRIDNLKRSLDEKKWEKAMAKVDTKAMADTIEKGGADAYVKGIEKRTMKIETAQKELQPFLEAHVEEMDKLPVGTESEREEKMILNMRGMKAIGKARLGIEP